ncbi:MAG: MarR family winged helix-turn-helix transcriptional regulator [Stellaceae bacterium]
MTGRRKPAGAAARKVRVVYAAEQSVGHQIRQTHRALQRALEARIRPHGITLGMWYFLRVLWEEDGLNQRELSARAGTAEPTTVTALHAMERHGLVVRVQNQDDRRKSNIFLTKPARELRNLLLPEARTVNRVATAGLSAADVEALKRTLNRLRTNLAAPKDTDTAD